MNRSILVAAALLASVTAGCTTAVGPVEVTRFSRPELSATQRGPISVVPGSGIGGDSLEFRSYASAVSRELSRLGYSEGSGATIAVVDLHRQTYRDGDGQSGRGPVSVGVGGSTGGWGSGVGLGLGFNLGGGPKTQVETQLAVTLRDRATGTSLWEGRARFVVPASSPLANSQLGADKMAQALFQGFPGRSGETILVR